MTFDKINLEAILDFTVYPEVKIPNQGLRSLPANTVCIPIEFLNCVCVLKCFRDFMKESTDKYTDR